MRAAALLLTIAIPALASPRAASAESARIDDQPLRSALLLALIPGGGHFYLGESEAGATYAGTILPLIGGGVWLDRSNDRLGRDEINTLGLLALKEWELSLFTTYRSARRLQGYDLESIGIDDAPVKDLFLSPFRRESYSDPMVAFAALLGAASAAYESRHSRRALGDIRRVGILGIDAGRDSGAALYGIDAFGISLAAGVGEEALWRGLIQNEMEGRLGARGGLLSTATLFGTAHLVNLQGEIDARGALVGTIGGLYLGGLYQRAEHRLAGPIAAHFWFNFAAMLTSFALDPKDNPLGVEVSFGF